MAPITGIGSAQAGAIFVPDSSNDPITVATALTYLRLKPNTTWVIEDSLANIQKNLDALNAVAAHITSLNTTDASQTLSVTATQYGKDSAVLAKWGAGDGNVVDVTGVKAAAAKALVDAKPSYVTSIAVVDTGANVNKKIDDLQTIAASGVLREVNAGSTAQLKITAAQYDADQDLLGLIKNAAYTLTISDATVDENINTFATNAKVKGIGIKDTTANIEDNLDALQRIGLRLKTIAQTDASTQLTVTGAQYRQDSLALGKIVTGYQLAVINAYASQASLLDSNDKVVTVSVADTAANIGKKWALLERLADSLTAVEVTDKDTAISITGDQLAMSETLLGKFTVDTDHDYNLAVTAVRAGQAADTAAIDHVVSVGIADTADNVSTNFSALATLQDAGALSGIALTGKGATLTLDASLLTGDTAAATQTVLDQITTAKYNIGVTGAAMADLAEVAANARVVSIAVSGTGEDIADNLDTLYGLGKRLSKITQTDSGTAIDVTQTEFESRAAVLAKVDGGYSVDISGVTAKKAIADAARGSVAHVNVSDTAENIVANWDSLIGLGATLAGIATSDSTALNVTADEYLAAQHDQLLGKFDAGDTFNVSDATVADAAVIGADDAVTLIDVKDDGSAVAGALSDLNDLITADKLHGITLNASASTISLHAGDLAGAADVLALINGGRYALSVDQVDAADAKALVDGNAKIATLKVSGDADTIAGNLADLTAIGHKLVSITQSDAASTALSLTGTEFDTYRGTLAKIGGGYRADLTDVTASKAAAFAGSIYVKSLAVSDTGANLSAAWDTLGTLGSKITDVAQSDSADIALTLAQWNGAPALTAKFSSDLSVSISGAAASDMATLAASDAVTKIQVTDKASVIANALTALGAESKLTQITISDPTTSMALSATAYTDAADVLALVKDANYKVALSGVAVGDVATTAADAHVTRMDVTGSAADLATNFDALAALGTLGNITLDDAGATLTLSATQILGNADTLSRITNAYGLAATGVAMADLADITAIQQVGSLTVADTAANISTNIEDLLALGGSLTSVHLSDADPALALTYGDWASSSGVLSKIDGSYQVDLSDVAAADASTLNSNDDIKSMAVSDTAANIESRWESLIALYNSGAGKLTALSLSDNETLALTAEQQTAGADMITALLSDATIETIG